MVQGEEDGSGAEIPGGLGEATLSGRIRPCDRAAPPSLSVGAGSLKKGAELGRASGR